MRPGGAKEDLSWECPEGFTLETVVPDGKSGLYLVGRVSTLHLRKDAKKPTPFASHGSSAGVARLSADGTLLLGRHERVQRIDARGKATLVAEGFKEVFGVAEDARGRIYVSDWERGEVVRIDGKKRTVIAKGLSYPTGLVFDSKGNLYVKESGRMTNRDMTVRRIDTDGKVRLFATVPSVSRWRAPKSDKPSPPSKGR